MKEEDLVPLEKICEGYHISFSFLDSLEEVGLIHVITLERQRFVNREHIADIEKIMRLHYDLGINLEGIDVISGLLQRMEEMEREIRRLKGRF